MEVPPSGVDDMTTLAYLHEPGVLQNLKSRYYIDEIYVSLLLFAGFSFFFFNLLCKIGLKIAFFLLTRHTQEIY